jgi:4-hydroxy-tetrahydrodipicolinate reductase
MTASNGFTTTMTASNGFTTTPNDSRAVRAVVYGVGELGKLIGQFLLQKGAILVGAVDADPAKVGRDLGEVLDLPAPLGVTIIAPGDPEFSLLTADVAVMAGANDLLSMMPAHEACIKAGMNLVSVGGGISWAWGTQPQLSARIDKLARAHGVTVTGSGNQELTMGGATLIASECHTATTIWHKTRADIEKYGLAVLEYCHVGLPATDFADSAHSDTSQDFGSVDTFMSNLAADLRLTIAGVHRETRAVTSETPRWSRVLERDIPPGHIVGAHRLARIETHQGITLVGEEDTSVLADQNDSEYKEWTVDGDPPIRLRCELDTKRSVAAAAVNRVPDVLAAEPGYRTIDMLPRNRFQAHPYRVSS